MTHPDKPTPCPHSFDDIENAWTDGLCAYCLLDTLSVANAQIAALEEKLEDALNNLASSIEGLQR